MTRNLKPAPHECLERPEMAARLERKALAKRGGSTRWEWSCRFGKEGMPINYCPWCGQKLPHRSGPNLALVKSEQGR